MIPAFKIEITGNHMLLTIPHISFVGKIYNKLPYKKSGYGNDTFLYMEKTYNIFRKNV